MQIAKCKLQIGRQAPEKVTVAFPKASLSICILQFAFCNLHFAISAEGRESRPPRRRAGPDRVDRPAGPDLARPRRVYRPGGPAAVEPRRLHGDAEPPELRVNRH